MTVVLLLILSYLIGSIPTALIVGKLGYGVDVREHGSGNLGGTNTFRTLGKTAGTIVIVVDILKGTLATLLPMMFDVHLHPIFAGLPAVLGHCYPIFAGFRGGKAVATSAGVLLGVSSLFFAVVIAVFLITLYFTKYISLSSMVAGVACHVYGIFMGDWILSIVTFALCLFVLYRHRSNIERIMNKTEHKVPWP
ncbi:MAG: glycerol-3-phosphate 1-O-acyltransferase PlsY [Tumebacillaceae bacterium]